MKTPAIAATVCVGAMVVISGAARAQVPRPRVVALTGRAVPEVGGSTYTALNRPVVGSSGAIYFTSEYNSPEGFRHALMYSPSYADNTRIFRRENDPVAELGGLPMRWGGAFGALAAEGSNPAFTAAYSNGATGGIGLWQSDGMALLLRTTVSPDVNAPGTTAPFGQFQFIALAGGGPLAVRASTGGPATANSGIWVRVAAGVAPFIIEADLPPDVDAGVEYDDFGSALHDPLINPAGVLALIVPLRGNVTASNNRALLVGPPGGERIVARTGFPAPAMPAGATFATLSPPWMNADNDVVFTGRVAGGGVGPNDDEGLWVVRWPSVMPELVVREGIVAPGIGGGILLHERTFNTANFRQTIINARGTIFFISGLLGSGINNDNDGVIYRAERSPGGGWTFTLLAREGQDAPGLTAGVDRYGPFGQLWANAANQLTFTSQIGGTSFWALFAGAPGHLGVIAAANRALDVGPPGAPELRTVKPFYNQFGPIYSSGGGGRGDGFPTCLSDAGTVVYRAEFTDGSFGIFEIALPRADFTGDGMISVQDIFDFLSAWFAGNLAADFDGNGILSIQDIFSFLESWFREQ